MRSFWFAAGAGVGVYAVLKARRAAEVFTTEGLADRFAAASLGADLFLHEVRTGMAEKETELRALLGLALDGASSAHRELERSTTTTSTATGSTTNRELQ